MSTMQTARREMRDGTYGEELRAMIERQNQTRLERRLGAYRGDRNARRTPVRTGARLLAVLPPLDIEELPFYLPRR